MTTNKPRARPRRRAAVRADAAAPDSASAPGHLSGMQESEAAALYRLMTWLSPAFPVGAFSYSSGIEWAVEAGDIGDAASLRAWLTSMLADGPGFCDGVFLAQTHRAASAGDDAGLGRGLVELASAFAAPPSATWKPRRRDAPFVDDRPRGLASPSELQPSQHSPRRGVREPPAYPVAVGVVCASPALIPSPPRSIAFLHALTANLDLGRCPPRPPGTNRQTARAGRSSKSGAWRVGKARACGERSQLSEAATWMVDWCSARGTNPIHAAVPVMQDAIEDFSPLPSPSQRLAPGPSLSRTRAQGFRCRTELPLRQAGEGPVRRTELPLPLAGEG